MRWASTLPSSTPHWSKESMFQMTPWVKTRVLVERDELAERFRREPVGEDRVRRAVALEDPVRHEPVRRAFGLDLLGRLAERQRLGLGEDVRQQHVVVPAKRVERLGERDEVAGNEPRSLMDQLVEGVLAVGSRLAPVDGAGLVGDFVAIERDVLAVALHRQLLQIGREALQVLLVGQHRHGLGAEEVVVPDRQQAHEHRQVALERRGAEVLVHLVEAVEHGAEVLRADGKHRRKADRRIHGVAPADPVPEPEHVGRVDAELRHFRGVRRDGDKMLGDRLFVAAETCERPVARGVRVGHRLQRREGFRRDDEERFRRVEIADGLREVGAVDVGDEAERHGALAVMLQRLVGHHRPEVGAADADVDDVANALAGVALPRAAADAVGEVGHLVEHGVDLRHHVLAVDDDGCSSRRAQGHVQDGPVFRDVDLLAPEHGVDALAQAGFLGQLQEQLERFVGDAVLRVVEVDAHRLGGHALAALGVVREELAQMQLPDTS